MKPNRILLIFLLAFSALTGCGLNKETVTSITVKDIQSAQINYNSPRQNPPPFRTTYSQGKKVIQKLIKWIHDAKKLKGSSRINSQSEGPTVLNIYLKSGKSFTIEPSEECTSTKEKNGSTVIVCRGVPDQMNVDGIVRLQSPELYQWITGGYKNDLHVLKEDPQTFHPPHKAFQWHGLSLREIIANSVGVFVIFLLVFLIIRKRKKS